MILVHHRLRGFIAPLISALAFAADGWLAAPAFAQPCEYGELPALLASDGLSGDNFGRSIAISEDGNTMIIAAELDDLPGLNNAGSAYVFVRPPGGVLWTEQAHLVAADAAISDRFGWAVAISGDTAIIAAPNDHHSGFNFAGSVYVFVRPPRGTTWSQQQKLTASDPGAEDGFGTAVAIAGDMALIGAGNDDTPGAPAILDTGSAYVFVRTGTMWTQQAKLTASDGAALDRFGYGVGLTADTAVIGAYGADAPGAANAGAAYVFTFSGSVWSEQTKLFASDAGANDNAGAPLAMSGDTFIMGSYFDDHAGGMNAGSAYVFTGAGAGAAWTEQAKLIASDALAYDQFGFSLGIDGDRAVVGSIGHDIPGVSGAGGAYVFTRRSRVWTEQIVLTHADAALGDQIGYAVAISGGGDTVAAGTISDDTTGSVRVFDLEPSVADTDCDGLVDTTDLLTLLADWGPCPLACPPCIGDFNGDCMVDITDLLILLGEWT
jgi:hypothetical protein